MRRKKCSLLECLNSLVYIVVVEVHTKSITLTARQSVNAHRRRWGTGALAQAHFNHRSARYSLSHLPHLLPIG